MHFLSLIGGRDSDHTMTDVLHNLFPCVYDMIYLNFPGSKSELYTYLVAELICRMENVHYSWLIVTHTRWVVSRGISYWFVDYIWIMLP
jgi:hypothetical protein